MDGETDQVENTSSPGYIGRIPVRNLWLLMFYASDLFQSRGRAHISFEENPEDLPDLIAEMLISVVELRQRRNLSLGYQSRKSVLNRVRGRIDVLATERGQLLDRGLVACKYEELTTDTPRNRYVRGALEAIARIVRKKKVAYRCRSLANGMRAMGVTGGVPTRAQLSADRLGRNDSQDREMMATAQLAFDLALPTEVSGDKMLAMPDREEIWVRRLFEKAVGGFYKVVLKPEGWQVRCGGSLDWQIAERSSGIDSILPGMVTDIVLDHPLSERRIVIDTKFNSIVIKGRYREESLRNGYLYQIYAYLRTQVGRGDVLADRASGLLLHPSIGKAFDESVVIQGHSIRFATVDLAGSSEEIRSRLLALC